MPIKDAWHDPRERSKEELRNAQVRAARGGGEPFKYVQLADQMMRLRVVVERAIDFIVDTGPCDESDTYAEGEDQYCSPGECSYCNMCRAVDKLAQDDLGNGVEQEIVNLFGKYTNEIRQPARRACHMLIDEIGSNGPENVEQAAKRAVERIRQLKLRITEYTF